jgi:hypothetical protein
VHVAMVAMLDMLQLQLLMLMILLPPPPSAAVIATSTSPSSLKAQVLQFMERWQGNIPS